jgi:hypothetical protein
LNREPTAKYPTALKKPSRIDPMNREPGAFPTRPPTSTPRPQTRSHPRIQAMRRTCGPSAAGKTSLRQMNANER